MEHCFGNSIYSTRNAILKNILLNHKENVIIKFTIFLWKNGGNDIISTFQRQQRFLINIEKENSSANIPQIFFESYLTFFDFHNEFRCLLWKSEYYKEKWRQFICMAIITMFYAFV